MIIKKAPGIKTITKFSRKKRSDFKDMDLRAAGLEVQPFCSDGKPTSVVSYGAYRDALGVLQKTLDAHNGLSLLQGPPLSGKSTLIREFVRGVSPDCSVAVVDGTNLNTAGLLQKMLRRFGYRINFNSIGELLAMIRVFVMQQASAHEPPLVVIENAHLMNPSALRATAELAQLKVRQTYAVKFILASDRSLRDLLGAPGLESLASRLTADFHLHPMTRDESASYLHNKLRAAGSQAPEFVFPPSVCHELWEASGGWPGMLDRIALLALDRADALPVAISAVDKPIDVPDGTWGEDIEDDLPEFDADVVANEDDVIDTVDMPQEDDPLVADAESVAEVDGDIEAISDISTDAEPETPRLFVTENGNTLQEIEFDQPRILIGRSEHNDVSIESRFISRHHMLIVRHGNSTFLMDLNSTNGTIVNSRRVSNHLLVDNDIISVGNHRIKFVDPGAKTREELDGSDYADTAIMKTLDDMRNLLEQENTAELPLSENIPTYGS